jgi:hypothetical protein
MLPCLSVNPARSMTLLAKSTIRPEDAWNPVRHLGSERGFPPSVAVQIAALEFANSVVLWRQSYSGIWVTRCSGGAV